MVEARGKDLIKQIINKCNFMTISAPLVSPLVQSTATIVLSVLQNFPFLQRDIAWEPACASNHVRHHGRSIVATLVCFSGPVQSLEWTPEYRTRRTQGCSIASLAPLLLIESLACLVVEVSFSRVRRVGSSVGTHSSNRCQLQHQQSTLDCSR
jgi:hypothetical protein